MRKVLAAIVAPPHLSMSGAARAAEQLSAVLARDCRMTIASMMRACIVADDGGPVPERTAVRTWLPTGLPWSRIPNRFATLFYRSNIPAIVAGGDFDLVHIHNPMPALEMRRVARACIARGVPYVVSTHGFNEVWNGNRIYGFDPIRRMAWKSLVVDPVCDVVRHAAGVFALSPADFPIIRGMGFKGDVMPVVTNGVDVPAADAGASDADVLAGLGIPPERAAGEITCMFLANHTPNKGLPDLLEAFAALERPFLLLVGGEKRDGIDYDKYVSRCRPGQKIVVTGRVSDEAVGAMFRRSDLFVFPTLADTFPLVVLEAMAHGKPVLASSVGGIPSQLEGGCGVMVEPGNVGALTAAIERLANEPRVLAAMGAAARDRVITRYSWSHAGSEAHKGYERVLGDAQRAAAAVATSAHAHAY